MFETEDACNLAIIADPDHYDFYDQLKDAARNLKPDQVRPYFKTVLGSFRRTEKEGGLDKESKKALLQSIYRVLTVPDFRTIFVEHWFASALPFSDTEMIDDLLSVLFLLVKSAPEIFDDSIARSFSHLVKHRPAKCLQLIALFAQHFADVSCPWYMVDVLFDKSRHFATPELVVRYSETFAYLVSTYSRYAKERGADAFTKVCELLDTEKYESLIKIYNSLCIIANAVPEVVPPFEAVKQHVRIPELQGSVLNLLLIVPLDYKESNDRVLLRRLFRAAEKDNKGALVLMRLAKEPAIASTMVSEASWMEKSLPTIIDTLRIFLVVFQHRELRQAIGEDPGFIIFLNRLIDEESGDDDKGNEMLHALALKILRRIDPLTPELIQELSTSGFIHDFLQHELEYDTKGSKHDAILMIDTIGKCCYTRELITACKKLRDFIFEEGDEWQNACIAAIDLCKLKKCAKLFREMSLIEYFTKLRRIDQTKEIAAMFLRAMDSDLYPDSD